MVDEVNANAGNTDIGAHIDDEAEVESMLELYTVGGKEYTVELTKDKNREKRGKCKSFTRGFCCAMAWLILPIACCVTRNTGGPLGTEG